MYRESYIMQVPFRKKCWLVSASGFNICQTHIFKIKILSLYDRHQMNTRASAGKNITLQYLIWWVLVFGIYTVYILNVVIIYPFNIHARYFWIKIYQIIVKNSYFLEFNRIKKKRNTVLLIFGGWGSLNFWNMVHIAAVFPSSYWKILAKDLVLYKLSYENISINLIYADL